MPKMETLSWSQWNVDLLLVVWYTLSQRFAARHVPAHLTLPHLPNLSVMITGATCGIGLHTARALALSGALVIFAVRNTNAAKDLISQWQAKQPQGTPPLHCKVMELDCLSFDSVRKLAEAWEARKLPLNLLINNAGIFCIHDWYSSSILFLHIQGTWSSSSFTAFVELSLGHLFLLTTLSRGRKSSCIRRD